MASSGRSSTSKETDYPVFQNVDPRWCGREESVLLDAIDAFGYGNWEVIADLFKFECADKNFTVQDIIDHCNLIFGKNALGAIYDSKPILERRTFLCDHTGSEDDAVIDSSDIIAAKNLTPEQLDSIGYMPLRGDFREVKEEDIASLIPEIRFKERYLQERCLRKNSTENVEEDMELLLDQFYKKDEGVETEDGEDFDDEDGEKEIEDLKEEALDEKVDEIEIGEKVEFAMAKRKMYLSVDEEVKESRVRTRSSIFKDIQIKEEKKEEMLSEQMKQVEEVETKKAIYPFGRKLRSTEKHIESKIGEQERTVKESEKKVESMEVVGRVKKGRRRRKNVKGKFAHGRVQEKASHEVEKRTEEIEEKTFVSSRRRPVVKRVLMEEQSESDEKEEFGSNGKWMGKYSMKEETDNFDETTEDEADEESLRDDGLIMEKEEKEREGTESEESYGVDGNMIITEILVEAVDMYCKDMRDKALANQLISRHGLVEHYFKCSKKQTNKETQPKKQSRKPLDLRNASLVQGVLKTFARFMEPEALEHFLKDFKEENRLRAKIDELRKELKNSDYAVFHFSSVNSDEDNGEVGGSSASDSETRFYTKHLRRRPAPTHFFKDKKY